MSNPAPHLEADRKIDGRRLRSQKSRSAIIKAALELVEEGVLAPTAQQISDRAGVGIRSFFRRFEDMEALFAALDSQMRGYYESLFVVDVREGSLAQRVAQMTDLYTRAFEELSSLNRSAKAQLWRSKELQKSYARNQRLIRKDIEKWMPELKDNPIVQQESVYAIASPEIWNRLRQQQELPVSESLEVMRFLIASALDLTDSKLR